MLRGGNMQIQSAFFISFVFAYNFSSKFYENTDAQKLNVWSYLITLNSVNQILSALVHPNVRLQFYLHILCGVVL